MFIRVALGLVRCDWLDGDQRDTSPNVSQTLCCRINGLVGQLWSVDFPNNSPTRRRYLKHVRMASRRFLDPLPSVLSAAKQQLYSNIPPAVQTLSNTELSHPAGETSASRIHNLLPAATGQSLWPRAGDGTWTSDEPSQQTAVHHLQYCVCALNRPSHAPFSQHCPTRVKITELFYLRQQPPPQSGCRRLHSLLKSSPWLMKSTQQAPDLDATLIIISSRLCPPPPMRQTGRETLA